MPEVTADTKTVPVTRSATHTPAPSPSKKIIQTFCWKGSQSEYKMGRFSERFRLLMVEEIVAVCQSESNGYVCITTFYR